jgi:hypothetical protein
MAERNTMVGSRRIGWQVVFPVALVVCALGAGSPARADLKLRFRGHFESAGYENEIQTIQYQKGEWFRIENIGAAGRVMHISILQCNKESSISLDPIRKEYAIIEPVITKYAEGQAPPSLVFPRILLEVETRDTGERKMLLGYPARHYITTGKSIVGGEGGGGSRSFELDAWYVEWVPTLPRCRVSPLVRGTFESLVEAEWEQKVIRGPSPPGFMIKEIHTDWSYVSRPGIPPYKSISTTEILELSTEPLDDALFEIPQGYKKVERLQVQVYQGR